MESLVSLFLTVLKLDLYFQVLSEQVHHHGLHMATDATAVPGRETRTVWVRDRENVKLKTEDS